MMDRGTFEQEAGVRAIQGCDHDVQLRGERMIQAMAKGEGELATALTRILSPLIQAVAPLAGIPVRPYGWRFRYRSPFRPHRTGLIPTVRGRMQQ